MAAYKAEDFAAALSEFLPLAEAGNVDAQSFVGSMYFAGKGTAFPEREEAARWFQLAAELGNAHAQYNLGYMFGRGEGVLQDYVSAHMWYNIAAAREFTGAAEARDALARHMSAADIAEAQRRARVCMASIYKDCD